MGGGRTSATLGGAVCVPGTAMVQRKKNELVFPEAETLFRKRGRGEKIPRGWDGLKWACTGQPSALSLSLLTSPSTQRLPPQPGPRSWGKIMQVLVPLVPQSPILTSPSICPHCPPWPGSLGSLVWPSAVCLLRTPPSHPQQLFLLTATTQYN